MSNLLIPVDNYGYGTDFGGNIPLTFIQTSILVTCLLSIFIFHKRCNKKAYSDSSLPYYSQLTVLKTLFQALSYLKDLHKLGQFLTTKFNQNGWRTNILGTEIVVINNGPMIQKLLSSRDNGHLERPASIYNKLLPGSVFKSGLLISEVNLWKQHRTVISKAFTYEYLKSYINGFNEHAENLVMDLGSNKSTDDIDNAKNLSSLLHVHALKMVSGTVMGLDILSHDESRTFHENLERYKQLVACRYQNVLLFTDILWNLHPYGRETNKVLKKLEACIETNLKRSKSVKSEETEEKSVLNVMIRAGLREEEISAEVISLIIAGHETVAISLNFLLFNLALHPQYQDICRDEVDKIFDGVNKGKNHSLTIDDLSNMKFLERCICENLRLFPLLPGITRELTSTLNLDENLKLDAGTMVFTFPWLLHRHEEYYPNPESYDPNRPGITSFGSTFQPFSSGPRNCIGWKMALYEMKIITAFILRHFILYTSDRMEDIRVKYNITALPTKPLNIELKRRK